MACDDKMDDLPTSLAELRDELVVQRVMLESIVDQLRSGVDNTVLREDKVAIEGTIRRLKKRIRQLEQEPRPATPGKIHFRVMFSLGRTLAAVIPGERLLTCGTGRCRRRGRA